MGSDHPPPWISWQSLPWQSVNSNYGRNVVDLRNPAPPIAQPAVLPSYADRTRVHIGGDAPPAVAASRFLQRSSAFPPPLDNMNAPSTVAAAGRRFLIFDQSGDGTSVLFSSIGHPPVWNLDNRSMKAKAVQKSGVGDGDMPGNHVPVNFSDGTDVSDGGGYDEMHEDTDEIDALLYSDSEYEDADGEEDEAFTGQSPDGTVLAAVSAEEVASNSVPAKRRRLNNEEAIDASLMDTASSERARQPRGRDEANAGNKGNDESSCVRGGAEGGSTGEPEPPRAGKSLKRARIQETLCVLRKIIPGGKAKDDTAVLDEAIRYLRSLKLKAKASGNKLK